MKEYIPQKATQIAEASANCDSPLKIAAFKDITAFILETGKSAKRFNIDVHYVKDADEAHNDLTSQKADLVFMSYDDTLSMALLDKNSDIEAVMPVHGGILDLCGSIDLTQGKCKIGIDTNSGYARALRFYFKNKYNPEDYAKLQYLMIGATNLRFDKLKEGVVDATLLNPPFSYRLSGSPKVRMYNEVGAYQGIVVNVIKSWFKNKVNSDRLKDFSTSYFGYINYLKLNKDKTIALLIDYYKDINTSEAENIYTRLWEADGLNQSSQFDEAQLAGTERLFNWDIKAESPRTWVGNVNEL